MSARETGPISVSSPIESERSFFAWLTVSIVLLVFVGFSRTYFLHSMFKMPSLSLFVTVHGAVMTGWILLFAVQTLLVTSNHTRIHRTLGAFVAAYAVLVLIMGTAATVLAARREVLAHSQYVFGVLSVLALELTQMLLFALMVGSGVWLRNRPDYHKRLMLLATFCILPNPIVRLFLWAGFGSNFVILTVWASLVTAVVVFDSVRNRRLNRAFGFGATIIIAFLYLAYFGSLTPTWQSLIAKAVG